MRIFDGPDEVHLRTIAPSQSDYEAVERQAAPLLDVRSVRPGFAIRFVDLVWVLGEPSQPAGHETGGSGRVAKEGTGILTLLLALD